MRESEPGFPSDKPVNLINKRWHISGNSIIAKTSIQLDLTLQTVQI